MDKINKNIPFSCFAGIFPVVFRGCRMEYDDGEGSEKGPEVQTVPNDSRPGAVSCGLGSVRGKAVFVDDGAGEASDSGVPGTQRTARQTVKMAESVKRAVRVRDGGKCVECRMTNTAHLRRYGRSLDVHRLKPGQWYSLENCVTLCRKCHSKKPKRKHGEPDLVYAVAAWGVKRVAKSTLENIAFRAEPVLASILKEMADESARTVSGEVLYQVRQRLKDIGKLK